MSKLSKVIEKGFDSEPIYNDICLKTKIKSDEGKVHTIFHNDKMPKESTLCICLPIVLIDSVFKVDNNYFQVLLE